MTAQRIFALFSTPLYVNNVGDFPRPDLRSLEYSTAAETGGVYNFRTSVDKNVLHRPELKGVHDVVMKEVDVYAHGVCGVSRNVEFYVTNSWINVHRRGQAAGQHIHGNSLISGVLYLQVNGDERRPCLPPRHLQPRFRFRRRSISTSTPSTSTTARAGATGRR